MRLTPAQIATIKSTAQAVLGEGVQVTLFGSRVHDGQKGGDVDLYVEIAQPDLMKKIRCKGQPARCQDPNTIAFRGRSRNTS